MSDSLRFATERGEVTVAVAAIGPEPDAAGMRVMVELSAADLQRAYDLGAFDLPATIPGGDVPGIDGSKPVLLELRLVDDADALLASSSREPGVLLGDMIGRSQAGGSHPHLVNEFVSALRDDRDPWPNAVQSANWTCVGICAHESTKKGGELVRLPDFTLG